ncbi:MAG: hypothetical protein M1820_002676 [Bogoriella megaspora]|nr:MAG: hypothetical protein M1820_002676 [Bogoriella megaspora]
MDEDDIKWDSSTNKLLLPIVNNTDFDLERQSPRPSNQQASTNATRSRSIAHLDGLRGLAAFLVYFFHHVSWAYGPEHPICRHGWNYHGERYFATLPFIRLLFTGGSASVAIFFVLSGYCLSISPLRKRRNLYRNLISASLRRPLRLFIPPTGVSLLFAFTMHLPFGLAPKLIWPDPQETIGAELIKWVVELCKALNPFQNHGIFTPWFPYDPPVWTMPIELRGSILIFALHAAYSRVTPIHRLFLFSITGLVLLLMYDWAMACFVSGVILAILDFEDLGDLFNKTASERARQFAHYFSLIAGLWLLSQTAGVRDPELSFNTFGWYWMTKLVPSNYYNDEYWRFWHSVGAALLVFSVLKIRCLQSFFATPALRYLGKISFSLYLTHLPLLWTVGDRIYRLIGITRPEIQTWFDNRISVPDVGPSGVSTRSLFGQCFILPLNLYIAHLGTVWLDEPSVQSGRWLVAKIQVVQDKG